jgi:hypothetical protein
VSPRPEPTPYERALAGLRAIADDPTETPARRRRAREALAADERDSLAAAAPGWDWTVGTPHPLGLSRPRTPGGAFMHTLGMEEGWSR